MKTLMVLIALSVVVLGSAGWVQAQERLQIVASFSILADVAQQVAGDAADVVSLISVGADPHTFSPTPQDLITVANADVILMNGINFEEGLQEALENAGEESNVVSVSACVAVLPAGVHDHDEAEVEIHEGESVVGISSGNTTAAAARCAAHYAELGMELPEIHLGEEEHQEGEEHHVEPLGLLYTLSCGDEHHEEGEHGEGSCDPHVWTNPINVMLWTLHIRDTLSERDPANAHVYGANAAVYIDTLRVLENDVLLPLIDTLPAESRVLVTNHETMGYFAAHYGFELIGVVFEGGTTAAEPSAAEIAMLVDTIRTEGMPAIFAENTIGDVLIQRVAEETGVLVVPLYSDSLGDSEAATYIDYMRYNVQAIVTALAVSS